MSSDGSSRRWRLTVAWAPVAGLLSLLLMDVLLMVTRVVTVFGWWLASWGCSGCWARRRARGCSWRRNGRSPVRYRVLRDLLAVAELPDGVTPGAQDAPG